MMGKDETPNMKLTEGTRKRLKAIYNLILLLQERVDSLGIRMQDCLMGDWNSIPGSLMSYLCTLGRV